MKQLVLALLLIMIPFSGPVLANPLLQLDIAGGQYDWVDQTIYSTSDSFTLRALFSGSSLPSDTYYISAAIRPKVASDSTLGSFSFDGSVVHVTSDMTYGTAPIETLVALQGWDSGDLPKHGIFATYFKEFSFNFEAGQEIAPYNSQDNPGIDFTPGSGMYAMTFNVNTAKLAPGYSVHFDLYDEKAYQTVKKKVATPDIDVNNFAPFSHDANSCVVNCQAIPEPGTLLLLGLGLVGIGLIGRRLAK